MKSFFLPIFIFFGTYCSGQVQFVDYELDPENRSEVIQDKKPYQYICQLFVKRRWGGAFPSTGFYIGDNKIVTAGHSVSEHRKIFKNKIQSVEIRLFEYFDKGRNYRVTAKLNVPRSEIEFIKAHPKFKGKRMKSRPYDYGMIKLKSDTLSKILNGSFVLKKYDEQENPKSTVHITGYPGDKQLIKEGSLWDKWDKKQKITATKNYLTYGIYTRKGDSGSPIWLKSDSNYYVVGIHNTGYSTCNGGTRVTKEVIDFIGPVVNENNNPTQPTDNPTPSGITNSTGSPTKNLDRQEKTQEGGSNLSEGEGSETPNQDTTIPKFSLLDTLKLPSSSIHGISGIEYIDHSSEWNNDFLKFLIVTDNIQIEGEKPQSRVDTLRFRYQPNNGGKSFSFQAPISLDAIGDIHAEAIRIDNRGVIWIGTDEENNYKIQQGSSFESLAEVTIGSADLRPRNNKGIEGLAWNSTQKEIYIATETAPKNKTYAHIWKTIQGVHKPSNLFRYQIISKDACKEKLNGISEILHFENDEILVLERQYCDNGDTRHALYTVDFEGADPTKILKKNEVKLADNVLDILKSDNFEAMSWGPMIENHRTLIMVSDDNEKPSQENIVLLLRLESRTAKPSK